MKVYLIYKLSFCFGLLLSMYVEYPEMAKQNTKNYYANVWEMNR